MLMLMLCVSTAMADFTSSYSAASWTTRWKAATTENISEGLQAIITGHNCSGTVYYTWNEAIVSEQGDIQVTVDYTGGAHKIQILGIEVVGTEIADYHLGASGGSDSNNVYTLSGVPAGEYDIRVFVCDKSGDHSLANTTGNIIYVGNITEKTYAPSEISTEYCYKIVNRAYGRLLGADGEYSTSKNATDGNEQLWAFEKNEDGTYYLRNLGHDKYLGYNGSNNNAWPVVSSEPAKFVLNVAQAKTIWNDEAFAIHYNGGDEYSNAHDANWGYENGRQVVRWLATATPSQWYFIETTTAVGAQAVTVRYEFEYNSEVKYTQETETFVGEEYPTITTTFPFGVSAVKPEGTISTADVTDGVVVKEIELTVNVPFEYANSYSEISQWYNMQIRDDGFTYLQYDAAKEYIPASQSAVPTSSKNSYAWAFVGDPFKGYEIVNYVAGETMVLSAPSAPTGDKNEAELARMVTKADATGNTTWMFYNPTHANAVENTFYVVHPTATAYAFNRQSYDGANTLCYWNGRDTGSALRVVECEISTLSEDLEALVAQANTLLEQIEIGTGLGKYSSSYENYEATYNEIVEYSQNIPATATDEDIQEKIDELQAIIASFSLNMPVAGKYYRIKSKVSGLYVTAPSNTGTAMIMESGANANNIFYWDNEKHFLVYGTGMYINGKNHAHYGYKDTYTFEESKTGVAGAYTIKPATANYWHDNGTNLDVYSGATHANCNWTIEEVTELPVKVSIGYATLYAPVALAIPEGVTAHTVTLNGEWATLSEPLEVIPANTGVVLQAEANTYNFAITTADEFNGENDLNGSIARTLVTKDENKAYYILAVVNEVAGFYNPTNGTDNTKFYNGGHKAYIAVDGAAQSNSVRFGEGTTGIENVTVENGVKAIYDLTGRRVESVTAPGIYIVNGKKVLVK